MKVTVAISNRHVHLTEETFNKLFGNEKLEVKRMLNQIGEFASNLTVDLECNGKTIEHVRVVGPIRKYDQVELLGSDLEFFGITAPTRRSGMLDETPGITIVNGDKKVTLKGGVIRAERHVHVNSKDADNLNLHERDTLIVHGKTKDFTANVKVSDNGYYELHIDKDEAIEYGLETGDEIEFEKVENR